MKSVLQRRIKCIPIRTAEPTTFAETELFRRNVVIEVYRKIDY